MDHYGVIMWLLLLHQMVNVQLMFINMIQLNIRRSYCPKARTAHGLVTIKYEYAVVYIVTGGCIFGMHVIKLYFQDGLRYGY